MNKSVIETRKTGKKRKIVRSDLVVETMAKRKGDRVATTTGKISQRVVKERRNTRRNIREAKRRKTK